MLRWSGYLFNQTLWIWFDVNEQKLVLKIHKCTLQQAYYLYLHLGTKDKFEPIKRDSNAI